MKNIVPAPSPTQEHVGIAQPHTLGPWRVRFARRDTIHLIEGGDGGEAIGTINGWRSDAEANARLIAAAPETKAQRDDLLEAAKLAMALIGKEFACPRSAALEGHPLAPEARPAYVALCTAIAKATQSPPSEQEQ